MATDLGLRSRSSLGSLFVAGLLTAPAASAFTIDFADLATVLGEQGATSFFFSNVDGSGIDISVTARDLIDGAGTSEAGLPQPYLDGLFNSLPGGLGVCQDLDPACAGSPDDNLGVGAGLGEVLILSFSAPVTLSEVTFNNGIHGQVFVGSTGLHVGAGNPTSAETFSDIFAAAPTLVPILLGSRFSFVADESFVAGSTGSESQLYVDSVVFVPEPSTGLLGVLGLLVIAHASRYRGSARRSGP